MFEHLPPFIVKILSKIFRKWLEQEVEKILGKEKQIEILKDILVKETTEKYKWKEKAEKQMIEFIKFIPPLTTQIVNDTFERIEKDYILVPKTEYYKDKPLLKALLDARERNMGLK
ncbi:MAG: hypothetical protein ABH954_04140 [Candidatus Omnitrophota bacterium]